MGEVDPTEPRAIDYLSPVMMWLTTSPERMVCCGPRTHWLSLLPARGLFVADPLKGPLTPHFEVDLGLSTSHDLLLYILQSACNLPHHNFCQNIVCMRLGPSCPVSWVLISLSLEKFALPTRAAWKRACLEKYSHETLNCEKNMVRWKCILSQQVVAGVHWILCLLVCVFTNLTSFWNR